MDFLKSAMEDSKARVQKRKGLGQDLPTAKTTTKTEEVAGKKWVKRGDLKKWEDEERERKKLERARVKELEDQGLEVDDEEVKRAVELALKRAANKEKEKAEAAKRKESEMLDPREVKRRLRTYKEPITLFGETDVERFQRLKDVELTFHEKQVNMTGRTNTMQDIQNEIDLEVQEAMAKAGQNDEKEDETEEQKKAREAAFLKRKNKYDKPKTREDFEFTEDWILWFLKKLLKEWEEELNERPKEIKMSTHGKVDAATHKQTRQYLKAFFKQCKDRTANKEIVKYVAQLAVYCQKREYVKAHESYLTMAIGNAAWPMGVTMVGIHERAGREKIFSDKVAHVLNDENTRKYIQAIKRLVTYHQHRYPTNPSKMVAP